MLQKILQPTQPGLAPNLLHGHGCGRWGLGGVVHAVKKSRVWRLRFCNCHFFWPQGFLESQKNGFGDFFLPPWPCPSLFNGPVCCMLPTPCLHFLGCGGLFCGVHSLLLGHHLLKKYKWWGMPACNFLLAWPQTSDEQTGYYRLATCLACHGCHFWAHNAHLHLRG